MANLKELLSKESSYSISDDLLTKFISLGEEIKLRKRDILIPAGTVDDNVYILKDGMMKFVYHDGIKESIPHFSFNGDIILSYFCFHNSNPAIYSVIACCDCSVLRISKADFVELMETNRDFSLWVANMAFGRLANLEYDNHVVNGDARERLTNLMANQRDILQKVSSKTIASYLGITPSYLCRLRKQIIEEERTVGLN
jgi:CRP-like cAMP-binding protein